MRSPAPAALTDWLASNALLGLLLVVAVGGLVVFVSGARTRRPHSPPDAPADPAPRPASAAGAALPAALMRLSRLTSLALVLASLALLGSAALVGLRIADGQDPLPTAVSTGNVAAPPSIGAVGRGTASYAPDTAAVVVGLEGTWPTLAEATGRVDAAVDAGVAAGADPADVRTVAYRVTPVQSTDEGGAPAGLQSVQLSYRVALSVRDLANLDPVLAAVAETGVSVFGVGIGVADPAAAAADARTRAVADARAKADQIAAALGVTILHADSTEEILSTLPPSPLSLAVADPATPPPPATGEVTIEVFIRFAVQ